MTTQRRFEEMLTGGHPNSLGRTVDVVDEVLADRRRLTALYECYFSDDEVVRLRVSSAMKRVTTARPQWTMTLMDGLLTEVAAIDQASTQWTLSLLFDLTRDLLSADQHKAALRIMKKNLRTHSDWIVLTTNIKVLSKWASDDAALKRWLLPHLRRLEHEDRKAVAGQAAKAVARLSSD